MLWARGQVEGERERKRAKEGGSKEGIGPQVEEERISWVHRGPWLMTLLTLGQRSWNQRRTEGRLPAQRNRLLFFLLSFPPPPSPSTFVEPSSMASSPSRSLSPKEFRKGRSESVAADLSVMKLMPNATGGCVDWHFSPRPFLFLLHHGGWAQLHRWIIRRLRSLWTEAGIERRESLTRSFDEAFHLDRSQSGNCKELNVF